MQGGGKSIVITVHGTNDSTEGVAPDFKWWQPESAFVRAVSARLAQAGHSVEVIVHRWSGANSALAREKAAERLSKLIRKHRGNRIHVVAHSHGGNVAAHAAELIGWGNRESPLVTLTTVGTPFFESRFGRAEYVGALSFLALTLVSALTMAGAIALALTQPGSSTRLAPIAVIASSIWISCPGATSCGISTRASSNFTMKKRPRQWLARRSAKRPSSAPMHGHA